MPHKWVVGWPDWEGFWARAVPGESEQFTAVQLVYPARLVSAKRLDILTGLVEAGGDALIDSETLYDPDWD